MFIVTADIIYLDGPFAGLRLEEGFRLTYQQRELAEKQRDWAREHFDSGKSVTAAFTGNRYRFVTPAIVVPAKETTDVR